MKKLLMITSVVLTLLLHTAKAQQSYVKFGLGYGLPSGSQTLVSETNSTTQVVYYPSYSSTGTSSEKAISGSYGSGLNLGASFGRLFSNNVGYDIELNYLFGKKYNASSSYTYSDGTNFNSSSLTTSFYARSFLVTPSLIIVAGDHKWKPRIKAGVVFGINKLTAESTTLTNGSSTIRNVEVKGGLSMGFRGSVGIDFNATKKTSFFTELVFTGMSYYPTNGEVTKYQVNGVDRLGTLSTHDRKVEYVKEINSSYSAPSNPNEPAQSLRESVPMGSIVLQFGVRIYLGKELAESIKK